MIGRPGRSRSRHLSQNQNRCGPVFGGLVVVGGRIPWYDHPVSTLPGCWGTPTRRCPPCSTVSGGATQPGNDSVLPGDYPRALAGVLALVWTGVLALAAVGHLRARGWTVRIRAP
jgi:hypothetical protein